MAKGKTGKKAKPEQREEASAAQAEQPPFTHKVGEADTRGDTPGQPAGAHLDAPSAGVKS